jgi:hypothetical protein
MWKVLGPGHTSDILGDGVQSEEAARVRSDTELRIMGARMWLLGSRDAYDAEEASDAAGV